MGEEGRRVGQEMSHIQSVRKNEPLLQALKMEKRTMHHGMWATSRRREQPSGDKEMGTSYLLQGGMEFCQ